MKERLDTTTLLDGPRVGGSLTPQFRDQRKRDARWAFKLGIGAAAFMSFIASVALWFLVDREQGLFVGLWVPSILALGAFLLAGGDCRERR